MITVLPSGGFGVSSAPAVRSGPTGLADMRGRTPYLASSSGPDDAPTTKGPIGLASAIRVLVVDDHPAVASGLVEVIGSMPGVEVVGAAHSIADALESVRRSWPDIVVCDVMFGDLPDGFRLAGELSAWEREVHVLFYSSYDLPWFLARAIQVGAAGYVFKTERETVLREAIGQVARGRPAFPIKALPSERQIRAPSPREREIMVLTGSGLSNGEIAARLSISQKTVESHMARLFFRYSVKNRTKLTMLALGQGWLLMDQHGRLRSMS